MSLSSRPYLVRGLYDWMTENDLTPQVLVNAHYPGVKVPEAHVSEGRIVLNIAITATKDLLLGDDQISFNARFSGRAHQIVLPIESVLAIFANEVDAAMSFGNEPVLTPADNKLLSGVKLPNKPEQVENQRVKETASSAEKTEISDDQANVIHVQFGRDEEDS
jgi:stringent starvation protein B